MIWILLISSILLLVFAYLKLWEFKKNKTTWFSKFLISQDDKLIDFGVFLFRKWVNLNKKIRSFIFSHLPAYCFILVDKLVLKISGYYVKLRNYLRGKLKLKKDKSAISPFLQEIAKVKKVKRELDIDEE